MADGRFPPRAGRAFGLALVAGITGWVGAIVIGMPLMHGIDPGGNVTPVLAVAWIAPAVFVTVYLVVFLRLLLRDAPWHDASGASLAWRLLQGKAPLGVAFWLPLALIICLWPLTALAGTTIRYPYYIAVLTVIILAQAALSGGWAWLTWANAGNAASPASQWPAKLISVLLGVLLILYYLLVLGATTGAIRPGA